MYIRYWPQELTCTLGTAPPPPPPRIQKGRELPPSCDPPRGQRSGLLPALKLSCSKSGLSSQWLLGTFLSQIPLPQGFLKPPFPYLKFLQNGVLLTFCFQRIFNFFLMKSIGKLGINVNILCKGKGGL